MAAAAADRSAADRSAEASAWAAEWSAWYGRYVARAAGQSERTAELYQGVVDAMSRGDLAPTALPDMLAAFTRARGTAYSERFAALAMRFFSRLVETAADLLQGNGRGGDARRTGGAAAPTAGSI